MNGPLTPIEPLFPTGPLSHEIVSCSVLMGGRFSPIEFLFPVEPLSPGILPCYVLMDGPLSLIDFIFLCVDGRSFGTNITFISHWTFAT